MLRPELPFEQNRRELHQNGGIVESDRNNQTSKFIPPLAILPLLSKNYFNSYLYVPQISVILTKLNFFQMIYILNIITA